MSNLAAAFSAQHVDRSTRALTSAIASGDTEAFGRFYRAWFDVMLAEARRIGGRDEAFCLDVVHDAMLNVIRATPTLSSEGALRIWVLRVVRTSAIDRLRAEQRRRDRERAYGRRRREQADVGDADLEERLAWLRRELSSLEDDAADLLAMRHRYGWTLKRIGRALRRHPGVLHARLARIMQSLRRRGQEKFDD